MPYRSRKIDISSLGPLNKFGLGSVLNAYHLASGANNDIIMLEYSECMAILKKVRSKGNNLLKNESAILKLISGNIAPRLLWESQSKGDECGEFIIIEYVSGKHKYALDDNEAAQLGKVLKHLHGIDIGKLSGITEKLSWNEYFHTRLMSQYNNVKNIGPSSQINEMMRNLKKIHEFGIMIESSLSFQDAKLVHTDITPLNVIYGEYECKMIDWELARIDFPEWDICSIFKSFEFTETSRSAFLEAYQGKYDEKRYLLISLLHYSNVALWRLCSFYCKGENRRIRRKFLGELNDEIEWIESTVRNL